MGKNNKARRAAKARMRARAGAGRQQPQPGSRSSARAGGVGSTGHRVHLGHDGFVGDGARARSVPLDPDQVAELLWSAAHSTAGGADPTRLGVRISAAAAQTGPQAIERGVSLAVDRALDGLWGSGWQPVEVVRQVRLAHDRPTQRAARHAIAAHHAQHDLSRVDARWQAQIDELTPPDAAPGHSWWGVWIDAEAFELADAFARIVQLLGVLLTLPPIEVLVPPPGAAGDIPTWGMRAADIPTGSDPDPVLDRIRALLAKAESTTFEAEAIAFTAKAQELMTRHAIDSARLSAAGHDPDDHPVTARVPVDPPYVDAKSLLLQHVASATRCRAMMLGGLSMSSVVGFAEDVRAVELLFTSLLVQAQSALAEAGRHAPPGTRVRGQGFRSAFLLSYATRIGTRLEEINQTVVDAEAAEDGAFLPVLSSRIAAVDDAVADRYGPLGQSRVRGGYDPLGWDRGRRAADEARLNAGDLPGHTRR